MILAKQPLQLLTVTAAKADLALVRKAVSSDTSQTPSSGWQKLWWDCRHAHRVVPDMPVLGTQVLIVV